MIVTVDAPKTTGRKAVVKLHLKNNFAEKIKSARAVVFLLDEQGKMAGQAARWVIGGGANKPALAAGATNVFNFVVPLDKPLASTNLTAKISFSRLVLEGGAVADPIRDVQIHVPRR